MNPAVEEQIRAAVAALAGPIAQCSHIGGDAPTCLCLWHPEAGALCSRCMFVHLEEHERPDHGNGWCDNCGSALRGEDGEIGVETVLPIVGNGLLDVHVIGAMHCARCAALARESSS